ncbi:MAG TPA: hypothetical protein VGO54_10415 [Bradyrhizobium sp.]|nr:hypothetical protein [Bradyrhizobium sp.]
MPSVEYEQVVFVVIVWSNSSAVAHRAKAEATKQSITRPSDFAFSPGLRLARFVQESNRSVSWRQGEKQMTAFAQKTVRRAQASVGMFRRHEERNPVIGHDHYKGDDT